MEITEAPRTAAKTAAHRKADMRLRGLRRVLATLKTQKGLISAHDYQSLRTDLLVKLDDAGREVDRHESLAAAER